MAEKDPYKHLHPSSSLRARAENLARRKGTDVSRMDAEELKRLVHELEVHQIELELQSMELRESQLELAKARDRYADLYEFAPVGYLSVAPDGKMLSANLTAAKLLATTREEIVKGKLTDLVASHSQDTLYHAWNEAKEDLGNVTCELEMLRGNLPEIDLQLDLMPHRELGKAGSEDSYTEMRVTLTDISQKKAAERNLAELNAKLEQEVELRSAAALEREQRLQSILDTAADAILNFDDRGNVWEMNLAAVRMFGYAKEELLGENVTRLIPPSYREEYARCFREYLETGDSVIHGGGYEILAQRKDGENFPVEFSISEVGHSGLFTGIMRDVTRRKELEKEAMEASAAEARRIGHELHEGFQQEMVALELLACTMGEQMNNIARIHEDDNNVCEVEESMFASFHETSETLCTKLSELNRRLRKLARGILPVQIEAQGLQTALEELAAATDALPEVDCRFESPEKVELSDNAVATHMYRIAQEAVTNAIRHSGSPELRISLSEESDKLVMEVEDQGGGFDLQEAIHREDAGLGLRAMEYRASLIGATLNIITKIDDGALVRCTLIKKGEANA